jgi:hypothetical protein
MVRRASLLLALPQLAVMSAKLCGPGGVRADGGESAAQAAIDLTCAALAGARQA